MKLSHADALPASTSRIQQLKLYYERHEGRIAVVAFVAGFVFDVVTLSRIDSWLAIGQQLVYLVVITVILVHMFFAEENHGTSPDSAQTGKLPVLKHWYYRARTPLIHFLFGSLLNLYTIYFFTSSSLLVSFYFMVFLVVLLVANESKRFKSLGLPFKFALLALCMLSFFAHVIPIFVGSIGLLVFLLSMVIGSAPLFGVVWGIRAFAPERLPQAKRQILVPFAAMLFGFLALYVIKAIPPVPLSIPFIGVYHGVQRTAEGYQLSHERPPWRIWHNGDQDFLAQRGDRVYVFFRIFSPTRFSDQVLMRWYWKDSEGGWKPQDSIPINIVGGRDQGFRGYGWKSSYRPGRWRVQIETTDEREIGRIYFQVEVVPEAPRTFTVELQ